MTQVRVAQATGRTQQLVSMWESGDRSIPLRTRPLLALLVGVDVDELFPDDAA